MKREKRAYLFYLENIQLAIDRIIEYISGCDFLLFKKDNKTIDAVIRNFEIIGEDSKNLPEEIKKNIRKYLGKKCIT